ncbi:MAG: YchJ family protein [Treponema sp.]|nr:YchJ family protein [Spirochaetia bacterium]MDY2840155.1 YchJ family protein [Treponema sp.]MDY5123768.1 YchJ family protein [Treponema sp.]
MSETKDLCPCGSGKKYSECCEPIIKGATKAPSAEACMRARYSSYVKHEIDYILNSCEEGEGIAEVDRQATEDWSKQSQWNGLKILRTEKGEKEDEAIVEFEADYTLHNMHDIHHEISLFKKINDDWKYVAGNVIPTTVKRVGAKIGRNDPCPCGSGKKYKQCCGR